MKQRAIAKFSGSGMLGHGWGEPPAKRGFGVLFWKRSAKVMASLPTPRRTITVIAKACAAASAKSARRFVGL
jgi:hypothetical protein